MDFYLSVILVIAGVAAGVLLRPCLLAFWRKLRNYPQSDTRSAKKVDGSNQSELISLNRDSLVQIKQISTQLSTIHQSIEQTQSALVSESRQAAKEMNAVLLKLLSSTESFANALQGSLQRNLDALNTIADQAESRAGVPATQTPSGGNYAKTSDGREGVRSTVAEVREIQSFAPFDELIDKIKTQVNQASCKGFKNIQVFVEQIREKNPIELESPSDQVFILFERNAHSETTGKAFVMPGSYLGRPWVDWFEMPKGVFERVEGTVEPATVARDANGSWSLVKSGSLSQQ